MQSQHTRHPYRATINGHLTVGGPARSGITGRILRPAHIAGRIAALGLAAILAGCSNVYFPGTTPVPLMSTPGEVQAAGFIMPDGMGARAAVSPLGNVLVCGTAEKQHKESESPRSHSWEVGAGWYAQLGLRYRLKAFAGYGSGYGRDTLVDLNLLGSQSPPSSMEASYRKYFAQMNYGLGGSAGPAFLPGAIIEGGFGVRFSYLDFYNYRVGTTVSREQAASIHISSMVRYGPPYAQIFAQVDVEHVITGSTYVRTRTASTILGIQLALGRFAAGR